MQKYHSLSGAIVNVILGFAKVIGGISFSSHALFADGIHSFSDLISDVMVLMASKYGSQDPDDSHPYGHKKIETVATLLLALLLFIAGLSIAWQAFKEILDAFNVIPQFLALPIALASFIAKEILFYYTRYIGKKIQSALIIANAWHHRSDSFASLIVIIGLLGSLLGFLFFDSLAAIIVSIMIMKMGYDYGFHSLKELVDTAVSQDVLQKIENIIKNVDGVEKIHQLRSRSMGGDIIIDVHIIVDPYISVSEGHKIAQEVHVSLLQQLNFVKDVTVHVDSEDDEENSPSLKLPSRKSLEKSLLLNWQIVFPNLERWLIHYLDGKIIIDLFCYKNTEITNDLKQRIKVDLRSCPSVIEVRLYSSQGCILSQ